MSILSARSRAPFIASLLAAAALLLGGCAAPADSATGSDHDDRTQAETTIVEDAWVKAVDDGMTAAFAVLSNDGHHDAHIVGASTTAAEMVELHEVVVDGSGASTMRPVQGGLVVPAGGALTLEPGGLHLMLMGVTAPLQPGDEIEIVLEFEDGSRATVSFVVKEFTGAEEEYPEGDH